MHAFFAGLAVGVFGGGAASYLFANYVIKKAQAVKAAAVAAADVVKKA